ncbi:MAG: VOC family protein [Chromatiales bacterium]|jgi:predicted enzyme related to lactoylglutathione lyase|nr:VOC family protein [Chromatiales bacterium]
MAKVVGVGGIFFKTEDPQGLGAWYRDWLGIPIDETYGGSSFMPAAMPAGGYTVWAPFQASTSYFDPSTLPFMMNLVVDDLDGALAQVAEGGGQVIGEIEELDFGRFGWFMDPVGNKVELWQPRATDT